MFFEGNPDVCDTPKISGDGGIRAQLLPYNSQQYEIAPCCVHQGEELGTVWFGRVFKRTLRSEDMISDVAIKTCKDVTHLDGIRTFLVGVKVLSYIGVHENLVESKR